MKDLMHALRFCDLHALSLRVLLVDIQWQAETA